MYLTGGFDYEDMRLFGLEGGKDLKDLLSLPDGVPSADTFERVLRVSVLRNRRTAFVYTANPYYPTCRRSK